MKCLLQCVHCGGVGRFYNSACDGREVYICGSEPCPRCNGTGWSTCQCCFDEPATTVDAEDMPVCASCHEWALQETQRDPAVAS